MATFIVNSKDFTNEGTFTIETKTDNEAVIEAQYGISAVNDTDIATIMSLLLGITVVKDTAVVPYLKVLDSSLVFDIPAGVPKVMPKDKAEAQLLDYTWSLVTRTA